MAVHGQVGAAQIQTDGLSDPAVQAMIARIQVTESETHNALFPAHRTADVTLHLQNGRRLDSGLTHARGGVEAPMSAEDIADKFMEYASPVTGATRAADIRDSVLSLTADDAQVDGLLSVLTDPA